MVFYCINEGKHIIYVVNVLLWYSGFANAVKLVVKRDFAPEEAADLFGYLLSYLPFAFIPRDLFSYRLQFCMTPEFYFMVWNKSWQN
jgi:hypothetical protein